MKNNVGNIDAIVRTMLGFYLAYFYYIAESPSKWQTLGLIFAGYFMLTAVNGTSPFYRALGIKIINPNKCGGCGTCHVCKNKK